MENTNLMWNAKGYDNCNGGPIRDAKELIEQIKKDGLSRADIIVDIGCGSGNVTKLLSSSLPHKMIYATDFDVQMVDYANNNYNDGTIMYLAQDIGLDWEHLDERLKRLEGKVDLVWSNGVLHWVPQNQQATAAKNIARLLKPKGRCYLNITVMNDFGAFVSGEEKKEVDEYTLSVPYENQFNKWRNYFEFSELSRVYIQKIDKEWVFETEEQCNQMFNVPKNQFLRLTMNSKFFKLPNDKQKILQDKYFVKWRKYYITKHGENPETFQGDIRFMFYKQFRVLGSK